jgi:phosphoribosyl 1,2-cyclic phosphodiesterase
MIAQYCDVPDKDNHPLMPSAAQSRFTVDHGISVQSLGSSSSGNAFVITAGSQVMLIDCGVGIRTIQQGLRERDLSLADISTICITHEHSDHIRTLPRVLRDDITVLATRGTILRSARNHPNTVIAKAFQPETFGAITVWPLRVMHDAAEPTGYMLEFPSGTRATLLTDLGSFSEELIPYLQASDLIIIESNYDEHMLRTGPYPRHLQDRVRSTSGHLANSDCGTALLNTLSRENRNPVIRLAHVSEKNNLHPLAEQTVIDRLATQDLRFDVRALFRTKPFEPWFSSVGQPQASFVPFQPGPPRGQLALDL